MKRYALYIRSAVKNRATILDQKMKACCYIEKNETLETCKDYQDDGFSGANLKRPSLKRLLKDVISQRIKTVVVASNDRLSRSFKDYLLLQELFKLHGVTYI